MDDGVRPPAEGDDDFDHGTEAVGYTVLAAVIVAGVLVGLLVAVARMM